MKTMSVDDDVISQMRMMLLYGNIGYDDMTTERDEAIADVRIAVLGARGVGKTSLIEQFVFNDFSSHYKSTRHKRLYYPSVFINEHSYQLQIVDLPPIPYYPASSISEWTEYRGYGLRSASAFLLVFDVTNEESFQHARRLRDQILDTNTRDIPIMVVANKCDSCETQQMARRDVATVVKKQWRCMYIEASAKHNWHVTMAFKEIMRAIDTGEVMHKPAAARVQDALRRNSCTIL